MLRRSHFRTNRCDTVNQGFAGYRKIEDFGGVGRWRVVILPPRRDAGRPRPDRPQRDAALAAVKAWPGNAGAPPGRHDGQPLMAGCARRHRAIAGRDEETGFWVEQRNLLPPPRRGQHMAPAAPARCEDQATSKSDRHHRALSLVRTATFGYRHRGPGCHRHRSWLHERGDGCGFAPFAFRPPI